MLLRKLLIAEREICHRLLNIGFKRILTASAQASDLLAKYRAKAPLLLDGVFVNRIIYLFIFDAHRRDIAVSKSKQDFFRNCRGVEIRFASRIRYL